MLPLSVFEANNLLGSPSQFFSREPMASSTLLKGICSARRLESRNVWGRPKFQRFFFHPQSVIESNCLDQRIYRVLQTWYCILNHHRFCWLSPTAVDTKDCPTDINTSNFWPEKTCMEQINPPIIVHSARAIGSLSPLPSRSNFRFLPGISFPPPNPAPIFSLNTLKSCSASSAHSRTRCLPSRCVCRSVLYAFSASCRDTNSKNANPRVRASNFFGSLTDFKWPWALLQKTDFFESVHKLIMERTL